MGPVILWLKNKVRNNSSKFWIKKYNEINVIKITEIASELW